MPKYIPYDYNQNAMVVINYRDKLQPGTFEHAIAQLFVKVLLVCHQQGLLGNEAFAIDGCKMPSNAAKEWSGRFKELSAKRDPKFSEQKQKYGKQHIPNAKGQKAIIPSSAFAFDPIGIRVFARQVSLLMKANAPPNYTDWMKQQVDSEAGKQIYSHRMSLVEPVFGNIGTNKGLKRFSLRGKTKVQGQ